MNSVLFLGGTALRGDHQALPASLRYSFKEARDLGTDSDAVMALAARMIDDAGTYAAVLLDVEFFGGSDAGLEATLALLSRVNSVKHLLVILSGTPKDLPNLIARVGDRYLRRPDGLRGEVLTLWRGELGARLAHLLTSQPSPEREQPSALLETPSGMAAGVAVRRQRPPDIPQADMDTLIADMLRGRLIPIVGAGLYDYPETNHYRYTRDKLAAHLFAYHDLPSLENPLRNLPGISHWVKRLKGDATLKENITTIIQEEEDKYRDNRESVLAVDHPLRLLAQLPFHGYVTTEYDDLLYSELKKRRKTPRRSLVSWFKKSSKAYEEFYRQLDKTNTTLAKVDQLSHIESGADDEKEPFVLYLNGNKDVPRSMVVTEMDYIHYLRSDTKDFPTAIQERIQNVPLLFLGHGLFDWSFKFVLKSLFPGGVGHSLFREILTSDGGGSTAVETWCYAVEPDFEDYSPRHRDYIIQYYGALGIRVFWADPQAFLKSVIDAYTARTAATGG
ncbi:MAG TPA: SIR2 family protein [Aggregatilineales bacterium]|nr:SIR2 family protein [Anaerolineales bacterium]HRE46443.1 SIR2 family protein [Aggregatilineales bacterium]